MQLILSPLPVFPGVVFSANDVPAIVDRLEMVVLGMFPVSARQHVPKVVLMRLYGGEEENTPLQNNYPLYNYINMGIWSHNYYYYVYVE